MELTREEFFIYALIAGTAAGFILGLIPLILGIKRKKTKLGVIGFVLSIIVGAMSGILSIIVSAIFIWLIIKKPSTTEPAEAPVVNENLIDVKIDNSENR